MARWNSATSPSPTPAAAAGAEKVSFKIKPGEKVGIIGRIGSGKTTLEKLALALYKPTEGAVLLDGVDVRQIDPADVRRAIGHVPQDPLLFYGSLKHNLAMGAPMRTTPASWPRPTWPACPSSPTCIPMASTC